MYSMQTAAISDGGNGIIMLALNGQTGAVTTLDVVMKSSSTSMNTNVVFSGIFNQTIPSSLMLDEDCDKFYWQKTS